MSKARILVEIGYTQAHHINVVPVPYKTVLMLNHFIHVFASLLENVNVHVIQIKYVVAKYPKGTSQNPI